jgi:hypothetical protein
VQTWPGFGDLLAGRLELWFPASRSPLASSATNCPPRHMTYFYLSTLSEVFWELLKWRAITGLPLILFVGILFWFNEPIGKWFYEEWKGLSAIWVLVSFGFGGLWIFLKVNYNRFYNLECENRKLRDKKE